MFDMQINRRQFTIFSSALIGLSGVVYAEDINRGLFLSAASDGDDNHWVIGFREANGIVSEQFRHKLPARAHHIALHEKLGIFVVIARRPGSYLWVGDLDTGSKLGEFNVPGDRHLFGHGVFSSDGRRFYTTENAYQLINGDSGRVAVWSVTREGNVIRMIRDMEFPSYGTGPHELLLKQDEQILVVANGGIRTHPDSGREKLNIASMEPSLAYISAADGQLLEQHFLDADFHKASIRHLDMNASGQVVMGMQYQGEPFDRVPLLAMHQQGQPLETLMAPEPQQGQMSQYVGSVRFDLSGDYFAASCPRGNMISFWSSSTGELLHAVRSRDGCGICAVSNGFLFTAGTGRISWYDIPSKQIATLNSAIDKVFWDNHLSLVPV